MNILHISSVDREGGRFTGYFMHEALFQSHNVEMAVWNKSSDEPWVNSLRRQKFFGVPVTLTRKLDSKLGLEGLTGLTGWILPRQEFFKRADILHLHLIHNDAYFSILSLPFLSRLKPLVWTIHDPWAMTGGCIYSFDCERWLTGCHNLCPYPRHPSLFQHHIPALHWRIKKRIYRETYANLIVASKWMESRVKRSPLLKHLPCHLIPFGIDLNLFKPYSKQEARERLGINPQQKVIAFRDVGLREDRFKGIRWLMEALQIYQPKCSTCLLILQDGREFQGLHPKYSIFCTGWIDGEQLALALSAADIFLMPSIQEAFGLMAVEAMACGTPVIVFDGTALPDVIGWDRGGLVVPSKDISSLAATINLLLENDELRSKLGKQAREFVEQEYSFPLYLERHTRLYEQIIEDYKRRVV